jgi:TRAP-type C4-dicarboxylate transport system permease small subunit
VLRDALPSTLRNFLVLVGDMAVILFLLVWCWASWKTLQVIQNDISPGLNIRLMWPFLAMPVCSGLMIFQQIGLIPRHVSLMRAPLRDPAHAEEES